MSVSRDKALIDQRGFCLHQLVRFLGLILEARVAHRWLHPNAWSCSPFSLYLLCNLVEMLSRILHEGVLTHLIS